MPNSVVRLTFHSSTSSQLAMMPLVLFPSTFQFFSTFCLDWSVNVLLPAWSSATEESRIGRDRICLGVVRVRDVPSDWPCHHIFSARPKIGAPAICRYPKPESDLERLENPFWHRNVPYIRVVLVSGI